MNYSQVEEISGPSIKIDRRREEPREVRVVGMKKILKIRRKFIKKKVFSKAKILYREKKPNIVSNEKKHIARGGR